MSNWQEFECELWPGAGSGPAWRIASDHVRVSVAAHGAHVFDVELRDGDQWHRVSVDYPQVPDPGGFHGGAIGRWANRIAGASYSFEDRRYDLAANEGPNQLHGGPAGFHTATWVLADSFADGIALGHVSPDGDQGFPGQVVADMEVMLDGTALTVHHSAKATEPTPLNLTSHLYWNLAGAGPLAGQQLTLGAARYVEVDDANIPVAGPPVDVEGSRFDCRSPRELGSVTAAGGYDHCFVLDGDAPAAVLEHPATARRLTIETDQPGLQVYTGIHLDPAAAGVALETQRIPDGPNRPDFGPAITTEFSNTTTFRFDVDG